MKFGKKSRRWLRRTGPKRKGLARKVMGIVKRAGKRGYRRKYGKTVKMGYKFPDRAFVKLVAAQHFYMSALSGDEQVQILVNGNIPINPFSTTGDFKADPFDVYADIYQYYTAFSCKIRVTAISDYAQGIAVGITAIKDDTLPAGAYDLKTWMAQKYTRWTYLAPLASGQGIKHLSMRMKTSRIAGRKVGWTDEDYGAPTTLAPTERWVFVVWCVRANGEVFAPGDTPVIFNVKAVYSVGFSQIRAQLPVAA